MMNTRRFFTTIICVFMLKVAFSQGTITIDHKTQRFINDVSTLDRTKYIHAYLTIRWNDPKFKALKNEYNFHPDYIGGRSLTNPASKVDPFNTNREDDVTYVFAKASLWTRNEQNEIVLSMRKYFYEMLKDLKGERVRINSSNIDVQTQVFVDGKQLFVMLNNLNDETQEVDLALLDQEGLQSVDIKQLKVFVDKVPELSTSTVSTAPEKISLEYGETAVLT